MSKKINDKCKKAASCPHCGATNGTFEEKEGEIEGVRKGKKEEREVERRKGDETEKRGTERGYGYLPWSVFLILLGASTENLSQGFIDTFSVGS